MNADFLASFSKTTETNALLADVKSASYAMRNHRVFSQINSVEALQEFMQWHVFAVWDFMSLVKRLQLEFTSVALPWTPPRSSSTARLINDIVLGEETDIAPNGKSLSHFELYLLAMEEVGANTNAIRTVVDLVAANLTVEEALRITGIAEPIKRFVTSTMNVAIEGSSEEVLGSFVFGREDAIPEMFSTLLSAWRIDEATAPTLVFYLKRHIALDADEHGPAAMQMIADHVGNDSGRLDLLLSAALNAIDQRVRLWDALAQHFEHTGISKVDAAITETVPF